MDAFNQFLPYYKKDIFGDFLNQYINDMLNKPIPYIYQYRPFALLYCIIPCSNDNILLQLFIDENIMVQNKHELY
jgi:hypothetical protein